MFTFMPYVWNNGGEVLAEDGKTCELDSENAVAALSMFNDLTNTYKVTPPSVTTYSWNEAQDAFLTGKASQVVLGSAAIYSFISGEHGDMNCGACLLPKGPDGTEYASFSGGDSIGVTSQCKDVDAAWEFIQFSLSKEVQVDELAKGGLLPARSDFFDNEYFNNTPEYQVLKEALEVGHTPVSLKYDEMYVPILEAMQTCLNGEKTPEQVFKDAAEAINKITRSDSVKEGPACRGRRPFHHKEKLMKRGHKKKISLVSYLFILPALILNLMFFVFPFLQSLLMSFYDWPVLGEKKTLSSGRL